MFALPVLFINALFLMGGVIRFLIIIAVLEVLIIVVLVVLRVPTRVTTLVRDPCFSDLTLADLLPNLEKVLAVVVPITL